MSPNGRKGNTSIIAYATKPGDYLEKRKAAFADAAIPLDTCADAGLLIERLSRNPVPSLTIIHSSVSRGMLETNGEVVGIKLYQMTRKLHPLMLLIVIADDMEACKLFKSHPSTISDWRLMTFLPAPQNGDQELISEVRIMLALV